MATCFSVFGLVLQVATLITAAVSHLTPFWIETGSDEAVDRHAGLWQNCTGQKCHWTGADEVPYWLQVVRIVHAVAVANALVATLVAMSYLCCTTCRYAVRVVQFNILVLVVGCMETVGVVTAYAVKYTDEPRFTADFGLAWSFYTAAASGICFILAIIMSVCETSNVKTRVQYERIQPTHLS